MSRQPNKVIPIYEVRYVFANENGVTVTDPEKGYTLGECELCARTLQPSVLEFSYRLPGGAWIRRYPKGRSSGRS